MAQAPREFALDFDRGLVFGSTSNEINYAFKKFKSGDTERLAISIVKANPSAGPGKLSVLSPSGMTLKVALGNLASGSSGTVYTSVTLSPVGNQFVGELPMNVSGIYDLFTNQSADVNAIIEFELDDNGKSSIDFPVVIRQQLIGTDLIDTPAPDVAIGRAEAAGIYVPRVRPQGHTEIWTDNDSGQQFLVYFAGGTMRYDPIT